MYRDEHYQQQKAGEWSMGEDPKQRPAKGVYPE